MKQTTEAEFSVFRSEVLRMLDVLGLGDWCVSVDHVRIRDDVNGRMVCDHEGRIATIMLNKVKGDPGLDVLRVARHEVYELLLAPLTRLAKSRTLVPGEIEEATHAIIRRLEKIESPQKRGNG